MDTFKQKVISSLAGLALIFGGATIPIVPDQLEWYYSYETVGFDTLDGDLGVDEYAVYGKEYYYRVHPKDAYGFLATTSPGVIKGKKQVAIVCEKCMYYDMFIDGGRTIRTLSSREKYNPLRYVKNAPQPEKTEFITALEALAPTKANAAAAFDAATGISGAAGTSLSGSHTNAAGADGMVLGIITGYGNTTGMTCTYNSVSMRLIERRELYAGPQLDSWELVVEEGDTVATGANTASCSWTTSATPHMQVISGTAIDGGVDNPLGANSSWSGADDVTFSTTTELDQVLDADDIMVGFFVDDKADCASASGSDTVALEQCSGNWLTMSNYGTDGTLKITETASGNPNLLGAFTVIFNGTAAAAPQADPGVSTIIFFD